ncbi:MAG: MDR family MFS transporter [Celeribacter sp.]
MSHNSANSRRDRVAQSTPERASPEVNLVAPVPAAPPLDHSAPHADDLSSVTPRAEQSAMLVLCSAAAVLLLASLGQTIVTTAMPVIAADLGGLDHITWIITAYLLASTISAPIFGKLGDLFGRKIVMQGGILIFLAGSVLGGIAPDMTTLVIARGVQGLGGGGLIVAAMAVVADVVPARDRGKAQGLMGGVFGVSTVVGPLLGGFLVDQFSWHTIFFVNLPVGAAAMAVLAVALNRKPRAPGAARPSVDYLGAALLATVLGTIVLIANLGGSTLAWSDPALLGLMALLAIALVGFVMVERRAAEPILPMDLFRNNAFLTVNATGLLVGTAMFGAIAFVPLYLQMVRGISPAQSGMFLVPMMGGLILTSMGAGRLMARTGHYKWYPVISTAILAVGMALLSTLTPTTPLPLVVVYMVTVGIGIGPVMSIGVVAIQNALPVRLLGVGTASANMFRLIGGATGTSAFGAIFGSALAVNLGGDLARSLGAEDGVRSLSAEAIAALEPAQQAQVLQGFSDALSPIFVTGAGLAVLAFLASSLLRELPLATELPGGAAEPEGDAEPAPIQSAPVTRAARTSDRMSDRAPATHGGGGMPLSAASAPQR